MDSGGSSQSSSAGEEEYDESAHGVAGADSLSSFFHNQQNHSFGLLSANQAPLPSTVSYFDPVASYLDQLSRSPGSGNPNPVVNLDPVWSRDFTTATSSNNESSSFQPPQPEPVRGSAAASQSAGGRNPRKRTRASRRAPTTVLTTDTSNFRSMVQEFTGIPAPPFGSSAASLFPRTRLDLFGSRGGGSSNPLLIDLPQSPLPPYLLRPFAQKIPVSLPFASSPSTAVTTTTTTAAGGNYQASPSDMSLLTNMPSNLLFPSLLHQTRKYPPTNPDPGSSKPGSGGSLELPLTTRNDNNPPMNTILIDHDQFRGLTPSLLTPAAVVGGVNKPACLGEDAAALVGSSGSGGGAGHPRQLRLGKGEGNAAAAQPWICSSSDGHGLA